MKRSAWLLLVLSGLLIAIALVAVALPAVDDEGRQTAAPDSVAPVTPSASDAVDAEQLCLYLGLVSTSSMNVVLAAVAADPENPGPAREDMRRSLSSLLQTAVAAALMSPPELAEPLRTIVETAVEARDALDAGASILKVLNTSLGERSEAEEVVDAHREKNCE